MEILLSHHFWRDNKNAVWNPASFPYPRIEQAVKKSYAVIETERPAWRKYDNITVFFDYRPSKDAYGRDIVPISFAFVPECQDPESCRSVIAPILAKTPNNVLKLNLDLPSASYRSIDEAKHKSHLNIFIAAGVALILLIGGLFFIKDDKPAQKPQASMGVNELPSPKDSSPNEPDKDKKSSPEAKGIEGIGKEREEDKGSPVKQPIEADKAQAKPVSIFADLCGNKDVEDALIRCPRKYFTEIFCKEGIVKKLSFARWLESEEGKECGDRGGQYYNEKKENLDFEIQEKLERIFPNAK